MQVCKSYCRLVSRMRTGNAPVFHSVTKFVAAFEVDILLCIVDKTLSSLSILNAIKRHGYQAVRFGDLCTAESLCAFHN